MLELQISSCYHGTGSGLKFQRDAKLVAPGIDVPSLNETGQGELDTRAKQVRVSATNLALVVDLGLNGREKWMVHNCLLIQRKSLWSHGAQSISGQQSKAYSLHRALLRNPTTFMYNKRPH